MPHPALPSPPWAATTGRRRVLGAGVALGLMSLTSACRVGDPFGGASGSASDSASASASKTATSVASGTPTQGADQGADPSTDQAADLALATTASQELATLQAAATATVRRFPGLRPGLAPFLDLHRAHLDALASADQADRAGQAGSPTSAPYAVPPDRAAAQQALLGLERASVTRLADHALAARSGAFARLLAGMSAGTAQRLARAGSPV